MTWVIAAPVEKGDDEIQVICISGRKDIPVKTPLVKKYNVLPSNKIISVGPFQTDWMESDSDWNQQRMMILANTKGGTITNSEMSQHDRSWIFDGSKASFSKILQDSYIFSSDVHRSEFTHASCRDSVIINCKVSNCHLHNCRLENCVVNGYSLSNRKERGLKFNRVDVIREVEEKKEKEDKTFGNSYRISFGQNYLQLKFERMNVKAGDEEETLALATARKNFLKKRYPVVVLSDKHGLIR